MMNWSALGVIDLALRLFRGFPRSFLGRFALRFRTIAEHHVRDLVKINGRLLVERAIRTAARLPQASEHEPCGLLRDADFFSELQTRNALARRDQQIHAVEPLVQRYLRPLHYRPGADGEVEGASQAAVVSGLARGACPKRAHTLSSAAVGAGWTRSPDTALQINARRFLIGIQREKLKCCGGYRSPYQISYL